jgi:carbonyl reductase 1
LGFKASSDGSEVIYSKLDVTDSSSRAGLSALLRNKKCKTLDVLINNAGVNLDLSGEYSYENARKTLEVNYWGTRDVCLSFSHSLLLFLTLIFFPWGFK